VIRRLAVLLPLLAAACVGKPAPRIATPPPDLPAAFLFAAEPAAAADLAGLLPRDDPAFRQLSDTAIAEAPTLAETIARIEAARAALARAGAERLPAVDANASVLGTRISPNQFGGALPPGSGFEPNQVQYQGSVAARWDADLFGRLRAQQRAAAARLDAADADAAAVRLALLAEIATAVIDWRTLAAREATLRSDLANAEALARLAGEREQAGIAPGFDRLRAEAAAQASRSRLEALDSERARLLGRLTTLTAQPGAQVMAALTRPGTIAIPAAPAALPSTLLDRRPDVRAAAARLAAADADLAAAARARFPRLSLSATVGVLALAAGDLFGENALFGTVGPALAAPLLDFGRIEAEIDRSAAEKRAAFQLYRRAVFTALGDAETGYALIDAADREARATAIEAAVADRQAQLADVRYRAGLSDFLTVIEARRAADASGERAAAARGRAARARVLLWQALGGDGPGAPIAGSGAQLTG